jgi:hypothetical protein
MSELWQEGTRLIILLLDLGFSICKIWSLMNSKNALIHINSLYKTTEDTLIDNMEYVYHKVLKKDFIFCWNYAVTINYCYLFLLESLKENRQKVEGCLALNLSLFPIWS